MLRCLRGTRFVVGWGPTDRRYGGQKESLRALHLRGVFPALLLSLAFKSLIESLKLFDLLSVPHHIDGFKLLDSRLSLLCTFSCSTSCLLNLAASVGLEIIIFIPLFLLLFKWWNFRDFFSHPHISISGSFSRLHQGLVQSLLLPPTPLHLRQRLLSLSYRWLSLEALMPDKGWLFAPNRHLLVLLLLLICIRCQARTELRSWDDCEGDLLLLFL